MSCNKCGGDKFFTKEQGQHTGLYCVECGAWKKWADHADKIKYAPQEQSGKQDLTKASNADLLREVFRRLEAHNG